MNNNATLRKKEWIWGSSGWEAYRGDVAATCVAQYRYLVPDEQGLPVSVPTQQRKGWPIGAVFEALKATLRRIKGCLFSGNAGQYVRRRKREWNVLKYYRK